MIGMNISVPIFPFHKVCKSTRIAIWGMGKIGKSYLQQVLALDYCNVVFTVDKNPIKRDSLVPLYAPEYIRNHRDFDYIVIAIGNVEIVQDIKQTLLNWGINEAKIVYEIMTYREYIQLSDEEIHLPDVKFLKEVKNLLKIYAARGKSLVRCGAQHDGGYVMLDDFPKEKIAYSFGINTDVSWDEDMADKGYEIFMYDHTIDKLPKERKEFHWFKKGIADKCVTDTLDDLNILVHNNGHMNCANMILKMDVEGAEWGFLERVPSSLLQKFNQVVMEIHGIFNEELKYKIISGLNKINYTHAVVHVHANNYSREYEWNDRRMADVLEVTWVNKAKYTLEETNVVLPISQDSPNCQGASEFMLGDWNKV